MYKWKKTNNENKKAKLDPAAEFNHFFKQSKKGKLKKEKKKNGEPSQNVVKPWIQFNVVLVNVVIQILCAKYFCNPHKLGWEKKSNLLI